MGGNDTSFPLDVSGCKRLLKRKPFEKQPQRSDLPQVIDGNRRGLADT